MPPDSLIPRLLRRAERRLRLAASLRAGLLGLALGAGLAALGVAVARTAGWYWDPRWSLAAPALGFLGGFTGALILAAQPLAAVALALEEAHGLKTRLTTALALAPAAAGGAAFAGAVVRDAEAHAEGLRPGSIVRWRIKRPLISAALSCVLLVGSDRYYPELDLLGRAEDEAREEAREKLQRDEASKIEELAREIKPLAEPPRIDAGAMDLSRELENLAEALRDPRLDRTQAMIKVSDLRREVKAERERLQQEQPRMDPKMLEGLQTDQARALARALLDRRYPEAADQAERMAASLESGAMPDDYAEALGGDLKRIAEFTDGAEGLAEQIGAAGERLEAGETAEGAEELEALADRLDELARRAERASQMSQASESLAEAQRAMGRGELSREGAAGSMGAGEAGERGDPGASSSSPGSAGEQGEQAQGASGNSPSANPGGGGNPSESGGQRGGGQSAGGQSGQQGGGQQGGGQQGEGAQSNPGQGEQGGGGWGATPPSDVDRGQGAGAQQRGGQRGGEQQGGGQQGGQRGGRGGGQGAGQRGGQGSGGSGSQAQGGGAGQSGQGSGGGGAGADYGVGSTNLEGEGYQVGADPGGRDRQSARRDGDWEEDFMRLYAERTIQATTADTAVRGVMGAGEDIGWRRVDAEVTRPDLVAPRTDRFLESRRSQKQSLDHQDIPLDYKDAVRKYFDSIEVIKR